MSKPSQVILVLEDVRHEQLVCRYLRKRGLANHAMRIQRSLSGKGSAESWVRKSFVKEVSEYRRRQAQTALIIVIDADTDTVQNRLKQLDQVLKDAGNHPVGSEKEQIARLVPKRNIETWILCLNKQTVNEEIDYKNSRDDWNKLIPQAAEALVLRTRSTTQLPKHCVDSLQHGVKELKRLIF